MAKAGVKKGRGANRFQRASSEEFSEALSGIIPSGGGDIPENGFEAFYYVCQSDFVSGPKDRQFILLLTDAEVLRLGERSDCPFYPKDMIEEKQLKDLWEGNLPSPALDPRRSRAIFVTPRGSRYEEFANELERAAFYEVRLGEGLSDLDEEVLAKAILHEI